MQEAIVTCTRAAYLMSIIEKVPNAAALVQVTIASCQRLWDVNGLHPGHGGRIFSDCTP